MATARCERFPEGEAHIRTTAGIVTFVDGLAEVDSPELVEALRQVPEEFGISVEGAAELPPDPPPAPETEKADEEPVARPSQSEPKEAWIDWAATHGMDRDAAADLTKAQLIAMAISLAADEEE